MRRRSRTYLCASVALAAAAAASLPACAATASGRIDVVGAESQYADVIAQVGGRYVSARAIERNPSTDPHTFEASPRVAAEVAGARLVVQNGLGYDGFMAKIEAASPSRSRRVIDVQQLLRLPDSTANPHLWYGPATMPAVARAVAASLARIAPAHSAYFKARAAAFVRSLRPWRVALAHVRTTFPHVPVATTEPVADLMLAAAGLDDRTPSTLESEIMNGVDPAPQAVSLQESLLSSHRVRVFVYNRQVTDTVTDAFLATARKHGIPVVGVYETMPAGYHYQSWMLAEAHALEEALAHRRSTTTLG